MKSINKQSNAAPILEFGHARNNYEVDGYENSMPATGLSQCCKGFKWSATP